MLKGKTALLCFFLTINSVLPVLAFTKPIPNCLLTWHVALPYNPYLGFGIGNYIFTISATIFKMLATIF